MTPTTEAEIARTLGRAAIWRILGGAFAYPTAPRLETLAEAAAAADDHDRSPELRAALEDFARAARTADPETIAGEYVFLFDRQVRCPPYEGAWGDAPQLAGKSALLADIAGFYQAFGLEPAGGQPETEDHLVAEVEFMSALALKEAWALAEGAGAAREVTRQAATAFLTDHLGRWAETFAEALGEATPVAYYTAAAALLGAWVRGEIATLGATPARLAGPGGLDPIQQEDAFTCPMAEPSEPHRPLGAVTSRPRPGRSSE